MTMRKLQYIQPEVKAVTLLSQGMMLPASPGVIGGYEPGKTNILKRKDGTRAVF